ncbi:hypothetical protein [Xanthobacter sp.]|uniref:hypothetical protein n=1 Tax=Xanthobacter sp. TaxID=35809 RepID=UPI0025E09FD4|nr:hypothetical protein [Xanthobacter sp.]
MTAYMGVRGSDGSFNSTGEGRIVDFDVTLIAHGESGRADEMITAEAGPDLIRGPPAHLGRGEQHLPARHCG